MRILSPESSHKDSRRKITQLLTADIKQINSYEITQGAQLGNHYHKITYEYFYVTKGVLLVKIGDNSFPAGTGSLFCAEPKEFHMVEALSDRASFLTFLTEPYRQDDPDVYK